MKTLNYDELCEYVQKTNQTGRYTGYYDGGLLKGRDCSILFETKDSIICHDFISPYMKFYVN